MQHVCSMSALSLARLHCACRSVELRHRWARNRGACMDHRAASLAAPSQIPSPSSIRHQQPTQVREYRLSRGMGTSAVISVGKNPPQAPRFRHHNLPRQGITRLLELHPGKFNQDVWASVVPVLGRLGDVRYEALSYVWGSEMSPIDLKISLDTHYCSLPVTQNLYNALRHLRYEDEPRMLWIDAVCINQEDYHERNTQVAMMADIYSQATRVLIWLGDAQSDASHAQNDVPNALQLLKDVGYKVYIDWTHQTWHWLPGCSASSAGLHPKKETPSIQGFWALHWLIHRPWFERLWVRQEVRVATAATIICGHDTVPWNIFKRAMFVFRNRCRHLAIEGIDQDEMNSFIKRMKFVYRICSPQSYSLGVLRSDLANLQCSDPRDRIYGMISLLSKGERSIGIIPRYDLSTAEVYQDITLRHIKRFRSLLLLTQCELQAKPAMKLPSWVPDWSIDQATLPMYRSSCYAHAGFSADVAEYMGEGVLAVNGVRVAEVDLVYPLHLSSESFVESLRSLWRRLLATPTLNNTKQERDLVEELCATLCMGHFRHTRIPIILGQLELETGVRILKRLLFDQESEVNSSQDFSQGEDTREHPEKHFEAKIINSCRDRSIVVTKSGEIALGPEASQTGDEIFVLLGCRTTMLLRRTDQDTHQIVGATYLSKVNHGEALLGRLPVDVRCVMVYNPSLRAHYPGFQDTRTQKIEYFDPRLRDLPVDTSQYEKRVPGGLDMGVDARTLMMAGIAIRRIRLV